MTQPTPPTVTGYVQAFVYPAHGGFGMWDFAGNGDDLYASAEDLITDGLETTEYHANEDLDGMTDDEDLTDTWADVTGNIRNEPDILVAFRNRDGEISWTGINRIDCHVLSSGEYVTAESYRATPELYTLQTPDSGQDAP